MAITWKLNGREVRPEDLPSKGITPGSPPVAVGRVTRRKPAGPKRPWPMQSDACGVNPSQLSEAIAYDRKIGVGDKYNPKTGAKIWETARERKEWCEAHGYYDRNDMGTSLEAHKDSGKMRDE